MDKSEKEQIEKEYYDAINWRNNFLSRFINLHRDAKRLEGMLSKNGKDFDKDYYGIGKKSRLGDTIIYNGTKVIIKLNKPE